MARVVGDNYSSSSSPPSTTHGGAFLSPTFGQLLKHVDDARKEATGDHALSITPEPPRALPFVLRFSDLTYNVRLRSKTIFRRAAMKKTILDDISGEARDGQILAVLGASGSGKSTLIDALANRIAARSLKGKVTLNGELLESRLLKVISAYVMQDDLLYPMLTVEETLMFAAEFRLPRSLSTSKKKARVEQLVDQLGLRNAAKTIIGDEGHRGVSGGERRRVSIGIDIVHDPIILFLDEPTSGLDSTSAFMVVRVLQRIAHSGSIVIMSVHQPSFRILGLLDQLLFMSRGQMVFSGSPTELVEYFAEFGKPIPENENWTEFALDTIRELEGSPGGTKALVEFHRQWKGTKNSRVNSNTDAPRDSRGGLSLKEAISASISRGKLVSGTTSGDMSHVSMIPTFANPVWKELVILSKRSSMNSRRTRGIFRIRLGSVIISGSILATLYWQLDNSPKGIQERLCFFALVMSATYYTCGSTLPVFLQERYIFMRETAHNTYRHSSYVLSHSLTALPSLVLLSLSLGLVTFFAVGLNGGLSGFFFYLCIILAAFWAGNSFVSFLSGIVSQVMLGYVILVAILSFFTLFSGFFITRNRIPDYWIWFHYISLVKYPYEGVLINEFEDSTKCYSQGVQLFDNTPLGEVPTATKVDLLMTLSKSLGMAITPSTCLTTGGGVLEQQAITQLSKWGCFWITVAWGFFFKILFYFALLFGSKNKRT